MDARGQLVIAHGCGGDERVEKGTRVSSLSTHRKGSGIRPATSASFFLRLLCWDDDSVGRHFWRLAGACIATSVE